MFDARLVIMDEPTAALGVAQTAMVLDLIKRLSANGIAVIVISHNLNDVFAVADRDGGAATSAGSSPPGPRADYDRQRVVELMTTGTQSKAADEPAARPPEEPAEMATEQRPPTTEPPDRAELAEEIEHDPTAYPTTIACHGSGQHAAASTSTGGVKRVRSRRQRRAACGRRPDRRCHHLPASSRRASSRPPNLVNLLEQAGPFIMLGMAEVFVLLLGEIDLSLGYSGAVGAAIMTILAHPRSTSDGSSRSAPASLRRRRDRRSSRARSSPACGYRPFVVTLAGLLFWEGLPDLDHQQPEPE